MMMTTLLSLPASVRDGWRGTEPHALCHVSANGTLDMTGVTGLTLTDVEVLTEEARELKPLALVSAATIRYPAAPIPVAGVPKGWSVSFTPDAIKLRAERGIVIICF